MSHKNVHLASIGELFSRTWSVLRQRWLTLLGIVAMGILLMLACAGLPFAVLGNLLGLPLIGGLVGVVLGFVISFAYMAAIVLAITDERLGVLSAFKAGLRKALSFAWLFIVLGFVITGGFLLIVIPGILFSIWFCLAMFVLAAEDERGMNAMLKSKAYVEGYAWPVFVRLFLLFILIPLAFNLLSTFLLGQVMAMAGPAVTIVAALVQGVLSMCIGFFAMIAMRLIYEDLRSIKQGISVKTSVGRKAMFLGVATAGVLLPFVVIVGVSQHAIHSVLNMASSYGFHVGSGASDARQRHAPGIKRPAKSVSKPQPSATGGAAPANMVFVKGGCFMMGDTFGDGDGDERPPHKVCLHDFRLDATEVTQRDFRRVTGQNPARFRGEDKPVTMLSWRQAEDYCAKLHKRLPTEAEWEYAAREGGKNEKWSGASREERLSNYAWHARRYDEGPHPVARKKPNALGLYDMTGNVWEMVADYYDSRYYARSPKRNPRGPQTGTVRVMRGGAWFTRPARELRTTARYIVHEDGADNSIGFRCAK